MTAGGRYRVALAKEDFKFSAAHFTLFGDGEAELLHGHNYRVSLELWGRDLDEQGLLVNLDLVKDAVRDLCRGLDSRTLLPQESPYLTLGDDQGRVEVEFGARRYTFPRDDVLLLPLANSSMELLARHFWNHLASVLAGSRVEELAVTVEESPGQRCTYRASLLDE